MAAIVIFVLFFLNVGDYAIVYTIFESPLPIVIVVLLGTAIVSICQRRILFSWFNRAGQWMLMNLLGWGVGCAVSLGVAHVVPGSEVVKAAIGGVLGGSIVGLITGRALVSLDTWES